MNKMIVNQQRFVNKQDRAKQFEIQKAAAKRSYRPVFGSNKPIWYALPRIGETPNEQLQDQLRQSGAER